MSAALWVGLLVAANAASLAAVLGAVWLLWNGVSDGWGWLLVVAVVLHCTVKLKGAAE